MRFKDYTFDSQTRFVKVEDEGEFATSRFEIGASCGEMNIFDCFAGFEFEDDTTVYEQIETMLTHDAAVVDDRDGFLPFYFVAAFLKFVSERGLIDAFQKPRPERAVYLNSCIQQPVR